MRKIISKPFMMAMTFLLGLTLTFSMTSCGGGSSDGDKAKTEKSEEAAHDHSEGDGHDHSEGGEHPADDGHEHSEGDSEHPSN